MASRPISHRVREDRIWVEIVHEPGLMYLRDIRGSCLAREYYRANDVLDKPRAKRRLVRVAYNMPKVSLITSGEMEELKKIGVATIALARWQAEDTDAWHGLSPMMKDRELELAVKELLKKMKQVVKRYEWVRHSRGEFADESYRTF